MTSGLAGGRSILPIYTHTHSALFCLAECVHVHLTGTKGHGNGVKEHCTAADRIGVSSEASVSAPAACGNSDKPPLFIEPPCPHLIIGGRGETTEMWQRLCEVTSVLEARIQEVPLTTQKHIW